MKHEDRIRDMKYVWPIIPLLLPQVPDKIEDKKSKLHNRIHWVITIAFIFYMPIVLLCTLLSLAITIVIIVSSVRFFSYFDLWKLFRIDYLFVNRWFSNISIVLLSLYVMGVWLVSFYLLLHIFH